MSRIVLCRDSDATSWDAYVSSHSMASVYHQWSFRTVIEKTYRHRPLYLMAVDREPGEIRGILPLFLIASPLMGKSLVSLPFCDYGGVVAEDDITAGRLIKFAVRMSKALKCKYVELRQTYPLTFMSQPDVAGIGDPVVRTSKARLFLELPSTVDELFSSFPAKLRSQTRKPEKEGCSSQIGGIELLDEFYSVFLHGMRDLGSPVHSKHIIANMLRHNSKSRLFVVRREGVPIAASLVVGFRNVLVNPWASFNREYQRVAPNMALYWSMLQYAVTENFRVFDFGRSSVGEGTYKFKSQWGAQPEPLYWYYLQNGARSSVGSDSEQTKELFIRVWRKLPLSVTRVIGPMLRRQISL